MTQYGSFKDSHIGDQQRGKFDVVGDSRAHIL